MVDHRILWFRQDLRIHDHAGLYRATHAQHRRKQSL